MKKNVLFTLTLVLVTTFIGCSKDDDNSSSSSIVGKWKAVKFEYYINGVLDNTEIVVEDNSNCPDYVEFKSNGTFIEIENDANCNASTYDSGSYVFNGTNITFNTANETTSQPVLSLTQTDMKTEFTETSIDGTVFKNVAYRKKIN